MIDIYRALCEYSVRITVYDPWASPEIVKREYGIEVTNLLPEGKRFEAVVAAVAHDMFNAFDLTGVLASEHVVYDVKGNCPREMIDGRL